MSEICRKDSLARNMNRMLKLFPRDYNIFPRTWCLPGESVSCCTLPEPIFFTPSDYCSTFWSHCLGPQLQRLPGVHPGQKEQDVHLQTRHGLPGQRHLHHQVHQRHPSWRTHDLPGLHLQGEVPLETTCRDDCTSITFTHLSFPLRSLSSSTDTSLTCVSTFWWRHATRSGYSCSKRDLLASAPPSTQTRPTATW